MSYKKDEDADGATVKVDRTAVFQEGAEPAPNISSRKLISGI
jgi:hypothetical protein